MGVIFALSSHGVTEKASALRKQVADATLRYNDSEERITITVRLL